MAFRPKLSEVSEPLREQAASIRQLGNNGLIALIVLIVFVLFIDFIVGFQLPSYQFDGPRWQSVWVVISIGIICDIIAINLRNKGKKLIAVAESDPVALQIANTATLLGRIGYAMIFIGPFIFGWLLLGVGTH